MTVPVIPGLIGGGIVPLEAGDGAVPILPDSPTDPAAPASGSALYFNTVIEEWMGYDTTRAKWLSVTSHTFNSGRNQNTLAGSFLTGIDGMGMSATQGYAVQKGTIVGAALCKSDAGTSDLEVLVNGAVVFTLPISGAGISKDDAVNVDVIAGILAFRNKSTGSTMVDTQVTLHMKRRV